MATNKNPNGKQLLQASLALFRQDTSIAALPVISIASAFASLVIIGGGLGGVLTVCTRHGAARASSSAGRCCPQWSAPS